VASGKARFRPCRVSHARGIPGGRSHQGSSRGVAGIFKVAGAVGTWSVLHTSNGRSGSESFGLPRNPPWPLCRCRPGPPGVSPHFRRLQPRLPADGLHDLRLSLRALSRTLESPLGGSSSHGIRVSPSRRRTPDVSTPGSRGSLRIGAARRLSRSALVVSHHLDGFLHIEVTGLLHPATGQGFATFRSRRPSRRPEALECQWCSP
jgi:hypothetical protein